MRKCDNNHWIQFIIITNLCRYNSYGKNVIHKITKKKKKNKGKNIQYYTYRRILSIDTNLIVLIICIVYMYLT